MLGQDWTYDLFFEDSKLYNATPMKGVYCSSRACDREKFMTWFKNCARDFRNDWYKEGKKDYDRYEGYIGDAFRAKLPEMLFSDYYKETYGQRPHLDAWFYIRVLGMPQGSDIARTFCASPIENAIDEAKEIRAYFSQAE